LTFEESTEQLLYSPNESLFASICLLYVTLWGLCLLASATLGAMVWGIAEQMEDSRCQP